MLINNPDEFNRTFDSTLTPERDRWAGWSSEALTKKMVSPEVWRDEYLTTAPKWPSVSTSTTAVTLEKATTLADILAAKEKLSGTRVTSLLSDEIEMQKKLDQEYRRAQEEKKRRAAVQAEIRKWRITSLECVREELPDKLSREMRLRMQRFGDVDPNTIEIGLTDTLHLLEFRRDVLGYDNHHRYRSEMERLARDWGQDLHAELQTRVRQLSGVAAARASDPHDELPDGLEEMLAEEAARSYGSAAVGVW